LRQGQRSQRVRHRLDRQLLFLVPHTGMPMQDRHLVRLDPLQPRAQQIGADAYAPDAATAVDLARKRL